MNAGTATASYTYVEWANHLGSSDSDDVHDREGSDDDDGDLHRGSVRLFGSGADAVFGLDDGCGWSHRLAHRELHGQRQCGDGARERELRGVGEPSGEQRLGDVHDREGSDDDDGDLHRGSVRLFGCGADAVFGLDDGCGWFESDAGA